MSRKNEPPRIKRFSQADPVHARARNPQVDFMDVVGITIGGGQSPSMIDIDLVTDINLGTVQVKCEKRDYELSLRRVKIKLELGNARIQPGTFYKAILQNGSFAASKSGKETATREVKGDVSAGGDAGGDITALPTFILSISGKCNTSASTDRHVESQFKIIYQVDLVTESGQDAWVAGGADGDQRRTTKDLRGGIIGDGSGDRQIPLCGLIADNVKEPVSGRIRVRCGPTDFKLDAKDDEAIAALFESLKGDEREFIQRRVEAERELKKRVAGVVLVKRNPRHDPKEHEVDLASRAFLFEPDTEVEPST